MSPPEAVPAIVAALFQHTRPRFGVQIADKIEHVFLQVQLQCLANLPQTPERVGRGLPVEPLRAHRGIEIVPRRSGLVEQGANILDIVAGPIAGLAPDILRQGIKKIAQIVACPPPAMTVTVAVMVLRGSPVRPVSRAVKYEAGQHAIDQDGRQKGDNPGQRGFHTSSPSQAIQSSSRPA